jgi:hypothetical protein
MKYASVKCVLLIGRGCVDDVLMMCWRTAVVAML